MNPVFRRTLSVVDLGKFLHQYTEMGVLIDGHCLFFFLTDTAHVISHGKICRLFKRSTSCNLHSNLITGGNLMFGFPTKPILKATNSVCGPVQLVTVQNFDLNPCPHHVVSFLRTFLWFFYPFPFNIQRFYTVLHRLHFAYFVFITVSFQINSHHRFSHIFTITFPPLPVSERLLRKLFVIEDNSSFLTGPFWPYPPLLLPQLAFEFLERAVTLRAYRFQWSFSNCELLHTSEFPYNEDSYFLPEQHRPLLKFSHHYLYPFYSGWHSSYESNSVFPTSQVVCVMNDPSSFVWVIASVGNRP